ncbi:hypothetical protein PHYBLDRAFT_67314 [Phycomyces blakesleeanus NRRL 1555(-)]|uniref:MULE transposase domain-containing protein n=1 Tax=Phycomyces blakesleeanus (strain ATCC 8743b / DSM 1359 / FGSC 10004 / NBRC 33097 / NRRL 1555) TaxID=763407 RepID=A0A167K332_PHYB8|nr:hypothetical protein PHYBLDRAFT_67314 [Phycomyces blakesleeanus NRRL 1555(-)]OAD67178.1 hypothetical protein PHYBLDRAFT_67314 [Phycomyces blakesleeanus NRRL 1555(-)]|eukprot:XP_018285218.1 hypothetical protein PHYBLDRAFT_67314 [Phycomyces blakesleeanus NRRL 1555(-)]
MREKLPSRNYCIFTNNISANSENSEQFAFGFQSPTQMELMGISQSFCLDVTRNISTRSIEILYSLVTYHPETWKGSPVAYMVTNNHSAAPISQWLVHLQVQSNFTPMCITVDCSIAETNAITATLPQATVNFCEFHVLRAWQYNLDSKITLGASYTSEQLNGYKISEKIQEFKLRIQNQQQFLSYFERKWIGTEELLRSWGRPYVVHHHQGYLTSSFIESWHSQLKAIYFDSARIRRLDRLVYTLTNDTELYYRDAVDEVVDVVAEETSTVVESSRSSSMILQRVLTHITSLYNQREDMERMMNIPGLDIARLELIDNLLGEAQNQIDIIRNNHPSYFKTRNT